ncbi:DUF6777 domain-containing protein [Streptomyces sp. NPDC057757]|uniref:DUF6777 domain-containing protein n=1 Tax=Streptomyces sp. NPDC057757 TaxID=3346241 RepID=UPI0036825890
MRETSRALVAACVLAAAFAVAGCGGDGGRDRTADGAAGEVFLEPAAVQGADPFTDTTADAAVTPPPVTRTPQSAPTGSSPVTPAPRSLSGSTPGLYGGIHAVGSCDVEKQIALLIADRSRGQAFAGAAGVSRASLPGYLRGLTSVVLRADTRVTNHGFRDGRASDRQSVLQAGTAVLVDNRGVPRVRCGCGNPLKPPVATERTPRTHGQPWSGYRDAEVVAVTPAPTVITDITIINIVTNTWIERRIGDDGRHDHAVRPPRDWTRSPEPEESPTDRHPREDGTRPQESPSDCATPTVTVTPGETRSVPADPASRVPDDSADRDPEEPADCPAATVTAPPATDPEDPAAPSDESTAPESEAETERGTETDPGTEPDSGTPDEPSSPLDTATPTEEVGPDTVPETSDIPDGGGLIPDDRSASDGPSEGVLDAPNAMSGG